MRSFSGHGIPRDILIPDALRARRRALQTAQALPLSAFSVEPHLKLSGIAIALAEVLESSNRPSEAYETYSAALAQLRASQATGKLSGKERMRAVALAHKLGEMAEVYQRGAEEAEGFLTFAVEEVLRVIKDGQADIVVEGKGKEEVPVNQKSKKVVQQLR